MVLTALMLPVALGSTAHAEDGGVQAAGYVADQIGSDVEQVSYTVGESGHPYKWMPYQPKQPRRKVEPLRAQAAQFTMPAPTQPTDSPTPHPLDDPFGDRQPVVSQSVLPNVEQLLADDTDKKLPADGLIPPPTIGSDPGYMQPKKQLPPLDIGDRKDELPDPDYEQLAGEPRESASACRSPNDHDVVQPIEELNHLTGLRDKKITDPDNRPTTCDLDGGDFIPRQWAPTTYMWQASGLCHKPAYFEDVHLERYGHSWGPYVQPLMSGAHFFLNVPVLPYKMGLYPPNECIYTLGYYRPGSCAPYMLDPLPLSVRAGLAQAGATVGMVYLLP